MCSNREKSALRLRKVPFSLSLRNGWKLITLNKFRLLNYVQKDAGSIRTIKRAELYLEQDKLMAQNTVRQPHYGEPAISSACWRTVCRLCGGIYTYGPVYTPERVHTQRRAQGKLIAYISINHAYRRDFFKIILPNQLSESSLKFVLSFVCVCVLFFCSMLRSSSTVVPKPFVVF